MFDHVAVVPYFANIGYFWCLIALISLSKPCVGLGVHLKAVTCHCHRGRGTHGDVL